MILNRLTDASQVPDQFIACFPAYSRAEYRPKHATPRHFIGPREAIIYRRPYQCHEVIRLHQLIKQYADRDNARPAARVSVGGALFS